MLYKFMKFGLIRFSWRYYMDNKDIPRVGDLEALDEEVKKLRELGVVREEPT